MVDPSKIAQAKLSVKGPADPATYWITITNLQPNSTWIVVPSAGTLWLFYEWSNNPASSIEVWHQGGSTTPVQPGENNIAVGANDIIMYTLANPGSDMIKLGYQIM